MSESDDITVLALSYLRNEAEIGQDVNAHFTTVPRAPLAQLINSYLEQHQNVTTGALLRCIANLNQGRMEDLNVPVFLSYLVDKCQTDESGIRQVINTLRTYEMVLNAESETYDDNLLIAARSESEERERISLDDLREQLRKRTK